jgi:Arc/MetJ-type ribon-helix-helix transcriptional regulator
LTERIASGEYATTDEVVQAVLREIDRVQEIDEDWLAKLAEESLTDPG